MNDILNRRTFFIREHTGVFKAANNYDIFNPDNNELIMECREGEMGVFTKILRFTKYKRMTPFEIVIKTKAGEKILHVKRGVSLFVSRVEVLDENEQIIGIFKQKFFSIGGKFNVLDTEENILCTLKGKWTSWDFKFMKDDLELAHISKKWSGVAKELFTSADNYMLEINDAVPKNDPLRVLILAAVMCIDMVLKE